MIRSSQKLFCTALAIALLAGTGFCEEDTGRGEEDERLVLGEEDLAERGEIARNMFRRITPGDEPLVQDVGTWPVAWEEFAPNWAAAAVGREYGAWVVPFSLVQESGATVIRDANDTVLWRGETDFAKPESASVTLVGGLVAEEDWAAYEGVRDWVESNARRDDTPSRGATYTNGLRFTSLAIDTNGTVELSLAWEEDGEADIFVYAIPHEPEIRIWTWTNDENQVVTSTNTFWNMVGTNLSGFDNDWEWRGTAVITNGEGLFVDTNIPAHLGIIRFYAAAEANDTDGDGWNDGWERFVLHTDPILNDTDGDGLDDWTEMMAGTDPNRADTDGDGVNDGAEVAAGTNPLKADTDGDGLEDGREISEGTNPLNPDTDGDGLKDGAEIDAGTNPLNPDTDGDGLPDGWEVLNGLDPLDATGADGSDGDPDGDGFPNALEYELGAPADNPLWNGEELAWKLGHFSASVTTSNGVATTNWQGFRVEIEDSLDCGGANDSVQNVPVTLSWPPLLDFACQLAVVVTGVVEDVDAGFDKVTFEVAGNTNDLFSSHNGIPDDQPEYCAMIQESGEGSALVRSGDSVILRYNTVGHKWHCGAFAEVTEARVLAVYAADLIQVRQRSAPCNRVPNPKQTTTNRLFVATEASGQVELDVVTSIPGELAPLPLLCAVYAGNTRLASAAPDSNGIAALSFTPAAAIQTNSIRIGIDDNGNGVLDPAECRPTATTFDVVSFTAGHYENRRGHLSNKAFQAAWGPYNIGASLLYRFLNRPDDVPEPFHATNSVTINCFSQGSLTHNAGAPFDAVSGNATLSLYAWDATSKASVRISESCEMRDAVNRILTNHAPDVVSYFTNHPAANEYSATWTTNNVPVNFANEHLYSAPYEYDLHVAFGHALLTHVTVGVVVTTNFSISHLSLSGRLEDLYDFDHERGGLNSDGAVLQIGWIEGNPARGAGRIFFDRVDFGKEFNEWKFNFQGALP